MVTIKQRQREQTYWRKREHDAHTAVVPHTIFRYAVCAFLLDLQKVQSRVKRKNKAFFFVLGVVLDSRVQLRLSFSSTKARREP